MHCDSFAEVCNTLHYRGTATAWNRFFSFSSEWLCPSSSSEDPLSRLITSNSNGCSSYPLCLLLSPWVLWSSGRHILSAGLLCWTHTVHTWNQSECEHLLRGGFVSAVNNPSALCTRLQSEKDRLWGSALWNRCDFLSTHSSWWLSSRRELHTKQHR